MQFFGKTNDDDEYVREANSAYDRVPRSASVSPMPLSARSGQSAADSQTDLISARFLPAQIEEEFYTQNRELICDDALMWLETFADDSLPGCVFTSLPDVSEVPEVAKGILVNIDYVAASCLLSASPTKLDCSYQH